jgi:hypothetical protein
MTEGRQGHNSCPGWRFGSNQIPVFLAEHHGKNDQMKQRLPSVCMPTSLLRTIPSQLAASKLKLDLSLGQSENGIQVIVGVLMNVPRGSLESPLRYPAQLFQSRSFYGIKRSTTR